MICARQSIHSIIGRGLNAVLTFFIAKNMADLTICRFPSLRPASSALALWAVLLTACADTQKCPYKPAAILEAGLPHLQRYHFEKNGQTSSEKAQLDYGVTLEIAQEICQNTRQEYRFTVQGDYASFPDSLWVREASSQLQRLSLLSPKQQALSAWAQAIHDRRPDFRLGEVLEVAPGIGIRIDRVLSPEQATLQVVFTQQ
jgi:hypothetical protein